MVVSESSDSCSFWEPQGGSAEHTALIRAHPWRLVFHTFSAEAYSPTVLQPTANS